MSTTDSSSNLTGHPWWSTSDTWITTPTSGTNLRYVTQSSIPVADTVSMTADGYLLVAGQNYRVKIPPHLFKDIVTLAEMGLLAKLTGVDKEEIAK